MKRILPAILIGVLAWAGSAAGDDERIMVDAQINGQPVRFAFDTGAGDAVLIFSKTAEKLGLTVTPPPPGQKPAPGQVANGTTSPVKLELGGAEALTSLGVVDTPAYLALGMDGVLGWPAIKGDLVAIDCLADRVSFLNKLPGKMSGWTKYHIITNLPGAGLTLELPHKHDADEILAIDTGSFYGVELSPARWWTWKTREAKPPYTLNAYYTPSIGLVVEAEAWAKTIAVGSLALTDLPVTKVDKSYVGMNSIPEASFEGTLGFAALKRLDIIVDAKNNLAYLRPKKSPPTPYDHNRLGAVFAPPTKQSAELVGHVIPGSPAFAAGLRDGDELLKIGALDCTRWRTDPAVLPLTRFWNSPAGTRLDLTVSRGGKTFETTATLRNILPPDATTGSQP